MISRQKELATGQTQPLFPTTISSQPCPLAILTKRAVVRRTNAQMESLYSDEAMLSEREGGGLGLHEHPLSMVHALCPPPPYEGVRTHPLCGAHAGPLCQ